MTENKVNLMLYLSYVIKGPRGTQNDIGSLKRFYYFGIENSLALKFSYLNSLHMQKSNQKTLVISLSMKWYKTILEIYRLDSI
jgi:hypothetical protein